MRRLLHAWREWRQIRRRVRDEEAFHLHCAGERRRFAWRHRRAARRELGGDLAGLGNLMLAHQVMASAAMQPLGLVLGWLLLLALSPQPYVALEGVVGTHLSANDRASVFLSAQAPNLRYRGLSETEFARLAAVAGLRNVQRFQGIHARAEVAEVIESADLVSLEARTQAATGNRRMRVLRLFQRTSLPMAPAKGAWLAMGMAGVALLLRKARSPRWAAYGLAVLLLHATLGLALWAVLVQWWSRVPWRTDGVAALALAGLALGCAGVATAQVVHWWRDLQERCPRCLESLRLPLEAGGVGNVLLDVYTCESVCVQGHGALELSRWGQRFRMARLPGWLRA